MDRKRRSKKSKRIWLTILIVFSVLLAAGAVTVKLLQQRVTEAYGSNGSSGILSATVTKGSISTTVSGSGVLVKEDSTEVELPSSVTVDAFDVEEGDVVAEGQRIATLNAASVMEALSELQDELDALDEKIAEAGKDVVSSTVKAPMAGRVKAIYAAAGDSVTAVMYENSALLTLSLDGYLAVDVETDALAAGETVRVTCSDGTSCLGTVEQLKGGVATILISDDGPLNGDRAAIATEAGTAVGSGTLYIHQPLTITGYAGTVQKVLVTENRKVSANTTLLTLRDTSYSAAYETLLKERGELEADMQTLLELYMAGAVYAPIAGSVETLDTDGADAASDGSTAADYILFSVCPDQKMTVSVSVDESEILSLSDGQTAAVTISSIGDDAFTGSVTSIGTTGTGSSGVSYYTVEVTIDKEDKMLAGMTASVSIQIEGVDDAVLVPTDAVTKTRSSSYVYTSVDETTGELGGMVEVTTGLSGGDYIEITEGLSEGDTVYYEEDDSSTDFGMFSSGFGSASGGTQGGFTGGGSSGGMGGGSAPDRGQLPTG